jgi:hypothetical protein
MAQILTVALCWLACLVHAISVRWLMLLILGLWCFLLAPEFAHGVAVRYSMVYWLWYQRVRLRQPLLVMLCP